MISIGAILIHITTGERLVVSDITVNRSGHVQIYFDDGSDASVADCWRYYNVSEASA